METTGMTPQQSASLLRLIDESDIRQLVSSVGQSLDTKDWKRFGAQFTSDAEFEIFGHKRKGTAEIEAGPREDLTHIPAMMHLIGHISVRVDGDTAIAEAMLMAVHVMDTAKRIEHADVGPKYHAECVRTENGWRIKKFLSTLIWVAGLPFPLAQSKA
jgi:uncharacterized protein (TIGR02246 family)